MLHPTEAQDQHAARTDQPPGAVANPRRTRLDADGRVMEGTDVPRQE